MAKGNQQPACSKNDEFPGNAPPLRRVPGVRPPSLPYCHERKCGNARRYAANGWQPWPTDPGVRIAENLLPSDVAAFRPRLTTKSSCVHSLARQGLMSDIRKHVQAGSEH